ncbi:hypothetical protein L3X37_06500 [Sabulilitoribacter arenilitoris]|uniref:Uncharacterized protein n=1 Tax=Wocania arenilitoris TaxID=2044858 RepID=A0AAE3JL94_9FLAO|nr:hypothetical protein [Wocania arenilitoris]MCF7568014.1 hypothetical protein [Wocania arenilitoris]
MRVIIIILALSFTDLCNAQFISNDDKLHLAAGALISGATYIIVHTTIKNKKKAFWYSLGASALAGLTKELIDAGQDERFDTGEIIATTTGGLAMSTTLSIFVGKNKNRKKGAKTALVN